jgi:hypothetical protein
MSVSSRQNGLPERNEQNLNAYGDENDLMESFYEPDPDQDLYGLYQPQHRDYVYPNAPN